MDLSPLAMASGRGAIAAVTLALLFRGRLDFRPTLPRIGATVAYAGMLATNVAATKLTTAANAILLAYTAPVYVALVAPFVLGERTRRADWLCIGATLGGMVLFFLDRLSATGFWGDLLAVGTGMCYAAFTVCMRAGREASPVSAVIAGHVLTALLGLPWLLADLPHGLGDWLGLGYLGCVQQGASLVLYVWCIKRLGALEAILLMTIEPLCNPVWVALGHGELPGPWSMAGGLVVLGAVTVRAVAKRRGEAVRSPIATKDVGMPKQKILFLCTGNACRSQMGRGIRPSFARARPRGLFRGRGEARPGQAGGSRHGRGRGGHLGAILEDGGRTARAGVRFRGDAVRAGQRELPVFFPARRGASMPDSTIPPPWPRMPPAKRKPWSTTVGCGTRSGSMC